MATEINRYTLMKKFHWGWRIGIMYTVFALSTISWVAFAMTKEVDLVRSDYYQYSLKQDQTMAARHNADALGTRANVSIARSAQELRIQLPAETSHAVTGTVFLYRPSSTHSDQTLPLTLDNTGLMRIPTQKLGRGIWRVTVSWTAAGRAYEFSTRDSL